MQDTQMNPESYPLIGMVHFLENYLTLWKAGRMEGWKRALPSFQPSIFPITKGVKRFLKHAPLID